MTFVTLHKQIHDDELCIGDYLSCLPYRDEPRDFGAEARAANLSVGFAMLGGRNSQSFRDYTDAMKDGSIFAMPGVL